MSKNNLVIDVVRQYQRSVKYLTESQSLVQEKVDAYLKARTDLIDGITNLKHSQNDNKEMLEELEQMLYDEERRADASYLG